MEMRVYLLWNLQDVRFDLNEWKEGQLRVAPLRPLVAAASPRGGASFHR
jgi:hypothetical protein